MEHDFVSRSSVKFPGAPEQCPTSPDGMFQTEISVPFLQAIFDTEFQTFAAVLIFGRWNSFVQVVETRFWDEVYHGTGRDTMRFRQENYLQTCGEADVAKTTKCRMGTQKSEKRTEGDKISPCVNLQQCRCSIPFLDLQAPSSFSSRCFC